MRMPLKICPRLNRAATRVSPQTSIVKPVSSLSAFASHAEHSEDERPRHFLKAAFGLLIAGAAVGSGLATAVKDVRCEGDMVLSEANSRAPYFSELPDRFQLLSDRVRRHIFFVYERRIRAYSSPEKIYEYFASIKESKNSFFMTPGDLMRAIIPVLPPSESSTIRGGYLVGERNPGDLHCAPSEFFSLFDTNGDGRISFEEFNFIRTLIISSLESFEATFKMFDRNGDGNVDLEEFKHVMQVMRERNKEKLTHGGARLPTRRSSATYQNVKLLKYLFGEDGTKVLNYKDFLRFLNQLHNEILKLEFSHYDCKQQGSIPAQDFGSSLVAAASLSEVNKYLRRVESLHHEPKFRGLRISFKDFEGMRMLRKKRRLLAVSAYAVDGLNGLSKEDFKWALSRVCEIELSDAAVEVIFYIFDSNGDGRLSLAEFLRVQDLREIGVVDPLQPGIVRMIRCMWSCAKESCMTG